MSRSNYDHDRLLNDPDFRKWVETDDPKLEAFWKKWAKDYVEDVNAIYEARSILKMVGATKPTLNDRRKAKLWKSIQSSVDKVEKYRIDVRTPKVLPIHPVYGKKKTKKNSKPFTWYKVAAVLAILATAVFFTNNYFGDKNLDPVPETISIVKSNSSGQRSTIFLPDGSKVTLAPESEISYQSDFQQAHRSISLKGEAFFEVVKNSNHPFQVTSSHLVTTALGTSFNIQSFPNSGKVEVSLVTGKVIVETDEPSVPKVSLIPGQQAFYSEEDQVMDKREFDMLATVGWKDGMLVFRKTSLEEVFNRLESWYGVTFDFQNKSRTDWAYTGDFDNVSLENVLKGISFVKDFDFTISGKKVSIRFNK